MSLWQGCCAAWIVLQLVVPVSWVIFNISCPRVLQLIKHMYISTLNSVWDRVTVPVTMKVKICCIVLQGRTPALTHAKQCQHKKTWKPPACCRQNREQHHSVTESLELSDMWKNSRESRYLQLHSCGRVLTELCLRPVGCAFNPDSFIYRHWLLIESSSLILANQLLSLHFFFSW